jgi:hypothetical protein
VGEGGAASIAFDSDKSAIPRMHVALPPVLIFPSIVEALESDGGVECGATSVAVVARLGELFASPSKQPLGPQQLSGIQHLRARE